MLDPKSFRPPTDQQPGLIDAGLTGAVLGGFFAVYNQLGRGFLESVYEGALALLLEEAGLRVQRQYPVSVYFKETEIGFFRADLLINGRLIVEIKRARQLHPRHRAQLINVLKASTVEVGLLLNYGPKPVFKRIIFTNDRKQCPKASQLRNSDKFTR
jgi:GxxExxY protein